MMIGNVEYDVSPGTTGIPQYACIVDASRDPQGELAESAIRSPDRAKLIMLGACLEKMVCTPNIESLL